MTTIQCKRCAGTGIDEGKQCPTCKGDKMVNVRLAAEPLFKLIEKKCPKLSRDETITIVNTVKKFYNVIDPLIIKEDEIGNEHYAGFVELLKMARDVANAG